MNKFKELRKEQGYTQLELSKKLGIDQTTVSKWELNKALPDTKLLIKLSDLFNVSTDYLLNRSTYYFPDKIQTNKLTDEEQEFLNTYRTLLPTYKKLIKQQMEVFTGNEIMTKIHKGEK